MRPKTGISLALRLCLPAVLFCAPISFAHRPDSYQITPDKTTMLIGESRAFRMVDQNGRAQQKVTWTISNVDAFQSIEGDELHLMARQAGEFRIIARTDFATAEATVTVLEGSNLPSGTVKWHSGAMEGCKTTKIIPARPTPSGPYVFQQSVCGDGEYVAAYTADGVQLWRRKLTDKGAPPDLPGGNNYEVFGNRLDPHTASVCDSVTAGTEEQRIRELLTQRSLTLREETGGGKVWVVDETNTECKLWFDEKSVLVKKKKVFVAQ
jgi:hypothetical protein